MPGWHPYPTSQRAIAWSAALAGLGSRWPRALRERLGREIRRQGRYLARTVEHDIGGNHVLKNGTALAFGGATLSEPGLLDRGLALLRRELETQLLADGDTRSGAPRITGW